ncbi:hypothetical protein PILCRDRAFT_741928 [Piloderma croceum F 1598]|uniref:Stealth protein CR2 conserved region 2 domain-containing protein n=1 Tax=Piloderma croceum (strain F 1598) TaxID=765440 RepID=A0A0C3EX84_PILCF|nr:hypothetical protein PILCRDRAFT_741928 [Piloderma croceum F 1598]
MRNALRMSIIHTWVNGSDKRLHAWKEALVKKNRPIFVISKAPGVAGRHFRDHDELVHSLRSVIHSLREEDLADLHLVTGDLPAGEMRIGQMPTWLDRNKSCSTHLQVHHHWDIFKMRSQNVLEPKAKVWRESILPTFNSIAIESQLVTLAPQLTDTALYFNDDFFLTRRLARSDFSSPLFGPVFRMQNHVRVSSSAKGTSRADPDGEWPSLEYANWLLDRRFGARKRPYMAHFVKTYSTPLLQEVANIWGDELTNSAAVRFRGAGRGTALGLAFFASSYVIERHREALLWSFLVARSDRDSSGTYSTAERRTLLTEIGFIDTQSDGPILVVPEPIRLPNDGVEDALTKAGLGVPLSTRYSFTSHEGGYAYTGLNARPVLNQVESSNVSKKKPLKNNGWPHYRPGDNNNQVACTLNLFDCFGDAFMAEGDAVSVQEVFKRVSFEQPLCGDCIISSLLGASGQNGLSAFLPPPTSSTQSSVRVALSMSKNWRDAEYDTSGGRIRAVSLLRRYSYVLGDSPAELVPISKSDVTSKRLDGILSAIKDPGGPAFVVLNDDMSDRTSPKDADAMNRLMWRWMEALWPEKVRIFPFGFYTGLLLLLRCAGNLDRSSALRLQPSYSTQERLDVFTNKMPN